MQSEVYSKRSTCAKGSVQLEVNMHEGYCTARVKHVKRVVYTYRLPYKKRSVELEVNKGKCTARGYHV